MRQKVPTLELDKFRESTPITLYKNLAKNRGFASQKRPKMAHLRQSKSDFDLKFDLFGSF